MNLGKAHWIWDDDLQCHVPCCTVITHHTLRGWWHACGNGPLEGDAIEAGDCGEHGPGSRRPRIA